jgi:hypothetical protein
LGIKYLIIVVVVGDADGIVMYYQLMASITLAASGKLMESYCGEN